MRPRPGQEPLGYSQTARCFNQTERLVGPERFLQMKAFDARSRSLRLQVSITSQSRKTRPRDVKTRGRARGGTPPFHVLPRPFVAFVYFSIPVFLSPSQTVPRRQNSNLFHLFFPNASDICLPVESKIIRIFFPTKDKM